MRPPARLGVLDWGIGGMGVVRELRRRAPRVPVVYASDTGFTPYGRVPRAELAARVAWMVGVLAAEGAVAVVVACNAASTVLADVRRPPVPVFGVVESAVGVVPASFRGLLGIVGGARTIRSGLYARRLAGRGRRVVSRIAQPLSGHIEAGTAGSAECARDLDRILAPLRDADAVLLACTHYPAIAPALQARLPHATLLDPAEALVARVLSTAPLPRHPAADLLFTTGDPSAMRASTRLAWAFDPGPCARLG
ncbi:MAG TPA: aspartate/glutamate racemase family protein [Polyangiaceae bacterium]|nr:aspartate/glutamate racemase family protein [Polyangiaceae bacterium]